MLTKRVPTWCWSGTLASRRWNSQPVLTCARQKIYEVLDSLIEKGFAQVVQEKTKLFSAVEPTPRGSRLSREAGRSGAT